RANNGVSTLDVLKIRKHILDEKPLPIPYAQIAADVNHSGEITTLDIILIRRVILAIDEEFANVPSWRFLPEYALGSQFTFQPFLDFNPFTAVWQAPDGERHYRAADSPISKSYLDDIELNLLNPDVTIAPTWSFRAIKSGDVNFNADVEGLLSEGGNGYAFSTIPHACLQTGQTATVLVKAQTTEDIDAYQMGFTFDKDAIEIIGVNQGDIAPFTLDNFGFNQLADGEIRTLWIDEKGDPIKFENNLKTLFKINIKAIEAVCDIGSVIEIEDNVLAGIFLDTEEAVVPMTLKLELIPGIIRHKLEQVYPNPTGTSISFQVELGEAATVSAQVFDQFGNYLTTSGSYGAGEQTIVFNNTSSLQQGTLSYVITAGSETFTGNIIKLQ
ncbi:MAG: T9SS type A sorting domain-containing protein, partial [Saprospiraceae bacterium]|nr:T9SS type A sorting domain-containing protein [Saprospiraceae bacterium]